MAQVIHEKGGREDFVWEDVVIPAPGTGEVHLRTLANGVYFADIYHRSGTPDPIVVGNGSVATVLAVEPGVEEFEVQ